MAADGHTENFYGLGSWVWVFQWFFFQDSPETSASGNPIDSFDRSKVRKIVRKYKKWQTLKLE